ncbi:hypothetical protein CXB51_004680 [Gossypium anomalum]|uniref:Replication factor C subunit 1 n=1 Tax=Gossypium anomalum TaxID=47600 RepID=A0A8J5ZHT6_9ROSI|nr:hypothetical protein CXB51_004680 [Gossypium anomalum]
MKAHDKGKGNATASKPANAAETKTDSVPGGQENSGRRKTSKYFPAEPKDEQENVELPVKRKVQNESSEKAPPSKKPSKVDVDDDFVLPKSKNSVDVTPSKKLKSGSGKGVVQKAVDIDESDEDDVKDLKSPVKSGGKIRGGRGASKGPAGGRGRGGDIDESDEEDIKDLESPVKSGGRGRGGRGASTGSASGRGRGGGRGGFMNFGERKDPPHKGEKEVPEGAPDCLTGLTFVISGTLDSLEREEAEDLIKRYGGRVTGSVSKKTNYLLCDEDIGGRKSSKAKELGFVFLSCLKILVCILLFLFLTVALNFTEDGLFDMIPPLKGQSNKSAVTVAPSLPRKSPQTDGTTLTKSPSPSVSSAKKRGQPVQHSSLPWTEKYRPKVPNEITGNQSLVFKQLHDWLTQWNKQFLAGSKGKGKKQNDAGAKKAVLLSGTPGIGKTTSAKLVSQMLGFQTIEVMLVIVVERLTPVWKQCKSIKELVSNEALGVNMDRSKHPKTVLIMDEVDGMSAGDRGGIADLIASIKISKIPIICICNDRYSQKLKSLVKLLYRKPTKQQMAKRLMQVANAEGLQVNEIALEELAERVNGDMRMALNQLQYMSLSMSVINYNDIKQRLLSSSKDEDISPFTAVDKLFGFNGGKLRMDERIDLSMSDPDLVPLLVQENYINYRPSSIGKDDSGIKRMNSIARAAESIGDGDIINVQIRRYRQWQLSQTSALSSCIIPAALLHGQRETLEQIGGWLGKNSTMSKNYRLLEDFHVHFLASRESCSGRETLRLEYLPILLKRLTNPLRDMPKRWVEWGRGCVQHSLQLSIDEAVEQVLEFMNAYSISQEDFDTIMELSKFQVTLLNMHRLSKSNGRHSTSCQSSTDKAYKEGSKTRIIRAADLVTLPGMKKAPKKRIAAILEPSDDVLGEENGDELPENDENTSDTEDLGIEVQMELKGTGNSSAKKAPSGRAKGGGRAASAEKKGGRGSGAGAKRKR